MFSAPYLSLALLYLFSLSAGATAALVAMPKQPEQGGIETSWLAVAAIALPLVIKLIVELKNGQRTMRELKRCTEMLDKLIEQHREPFGVSRLEDDMDANARRIVALMSKLGVKDTEIRH